MSTTRFALIGTGGIAQTYSQAFRACDSSDLTAVADIDRDSAEAFAEPFKATFTENYRDLNTDDFDAVVVSTPPNTHREIATYFMDKGVHVLCEKPLCLSVEDAVAMAENAEKNGVVFTMATKFRFVEDIVKAKSLMASGAIGEVIQFENAFTADVDMTSRWNANAEVGGGGVLIDNGTHSVDIIRYFLGGITDILAVDAGSKRDMSVDENVMMFAKSKKGVVARIDLTWGINKELPNFVSIYGTSGTIHVGWGESKYKTSSNPEWNVFGTGYDKVQAFVSKLANFRGAINGTDQLLVSPQDAVASVQVIDAAYKSLNQNLWQPIIEKTMSKNG